MQSALSRLSGQGAFFYVIIASMLGIFAKLFGDGSEAKLKRFSPILGNINSLEAEVKGLAKEDFFAKTTEFKKHISEGGTFEEILPFAFALVREAARRTLRHPHFYLPLF